MRLVFDRIYFWICRRSFSNVPKLFLIYKICTMHSRRRNDGSAATLYYYVFQGVENVRWKINVFQFSNYSVRFRFFRLVAIFRQFRCLFGKEMNVFNDGARKESRMKLLCMLLRMKFWLVLSWLGVGFYYPCISSSVKLLYKSIHNHMDSL